MAHLYKTYLFKEKDPVIDLLRTEIADREFNLNVLAYTSGVSRGTLSNWFSGATRRPQFASVSAVAGAMGLEFGLRRKAKRRRNGHA